MNNPLVMGYSMLIGHLRVKLKKMRPAAGRFVRLNPLHFQRLGVFPVDTHLFDITIFFN
jgi:hypothetical protein